MKQIKELIKIAENVIPGKYLLAAGFCAGLFCCAYFVIIVLIIINSINK